MPPYGSQHSTAAPSPGNGIIHRVFFEAESEWSTKYFWGRGKGHFEMPIPQDVGEDVWIIPSNKSHSLLETLQRRESFNLKIGKYVGPNPWGLANICFYITLVHLQLGLGTWRRWWWLFSGGQEVKITKSRKGRPDSVCFASSQIPTWLPSRSAELHFHRDVILGPILLKWIWFVNHGMTVFLNLQDIFLWRMSSAFHPVYDHVGKV